MSWLGPHSKISSAAVRVAGPTSTVPGLAADCSAAAMAHHLAYRPVPHLVPFTHRPHHPAHVRTAPALKPKQ